MTYEEAKQVIFTEWKCVDRNDGIHCDRKCEECDLVLPIDTIRDAYNIALNAMEIVNDAEKIVRCRDCTFYVDSGCGNVDSESPCRNLLDVRPDWFCADGERREENG